MRAEDVTERERAEDARAEAEASERRAAFLADASVVLASSLDYEATLTSVARLAVPFLADWCSVDMLEPDETVRRIAVAHADPSKAAVAQLVAIYPPDPRGAHPRTKVLRTGRSEIIPEVTDAGLAAAAANPDHLRIMRELGYRSAMIVALVARGRTLGAMTFVTAESGRRYAASDLALAEELAGRAALAADNARLYRDAQRMEERSARQAARQRALAEASWVFTEASLDPGSVLDAVVRQVGEVIGDVCGIGMLSEDRKWLVTQALYHPDPEAHTMLTRLGALPQPADEGLRAPVIRTGQPVLIPVVREEELRPRLDPAWNVYFARFPLHSALFVPLRVHGRVTGVLGVTRATPERPYDLDDQAFLQEIADRAALAIENARLYRDGQLARAEAEDANRTKDEFLAMLSHELRSPLGVILTWAQLLRAGRLDDAKAKRAVEAIEHSARLQARLIEDLLDISRIESGKLALELASVELGSVIAAAVEAARTTADAKRITLEVRLDPAGAPVRGDGARLQQVLGNLLSNAIKFTPEGGRVSVESRPLGAHVEVTVRDTGIGIPAGVLPHVFDRFRQADSSITRKHGGLGLGLAIVRHLVELHGGSIEAESPGEAQGATFRVRLPLGAGAHAAGATRKPAHPTPPEGDGPSLQGIRVLVVDDEAGSRDFLATVLSERGAEVIAAAGAEEAVGLFAASSPDVLVTDLAMPEEDGFSLVRRLRALGGAGSRQTPAIALTALASAKDRRQALAAGFSLHLTKPVEPAEVVAAVARAARGTR